MVQFFTSPLYISALPPGLGGFARSRFLLPLAVLVLGAITLLVSPFSWGFLATVILMCMVALLYAFYTCYTLVKGEYYILKGTIKAIESANAFSGAIENFTRSGKNQKLIIEQPGGEFAAIYLGRKVKNSFAVGLPVVVYAENIYDENGIETVRSYYTIVIAQDAPPQEPQVEVDVEIEESPQDMGFPETQETVEVDETA